MNEDGGRELKSHLTLTSMVFVEDLGKVFRIKQRTKVAKSAKMARPTNERAAGSEKLDRIEFSPFVGLSKIE